MKKQYLEEQALIEDAFRLACKIYESGFRPSVIVGIWRGGSAVGIYVQECLQALGVNTDHISLRTSYQGLPAYHSNPDRSASIRVHGTQYLIERLNADDRLLIVDDVFASGYSIDTVLARLQRQLKRNMPADTRIATLYLRDNAQRVDLRPDYYLHRTDRWLVFPYELRGLSLEEIEQNKPWAFDVLKPDFIEPKA